MCIKEHNVCIQPFITIYKIWQCNYQTSNHVNFPRRLQVILCRSMSDRSSSKPSVMESDPMKNIIDAFFDSAARGDMEQLSKFLSGKFDLNIQNDRGWSALMLAARNGHVAVIKALLNKNCNTKQINSTGQTAYDVAVFWNQEEAAGVLKDSVHRQENTGGEVRNYFSLNPLDRCADKRKDDEWISSVVKKDSTKFLALSNLEPLIVSNTDEKKSKGMFKLALLSYKDLAFHLSSKPLLLFLGVYKENVLFKQWTTLDDTEKGAWFAVDVSGVDSDCITSLIPDSSFMNPFPGAMMFTAVHGGIFAEARSLMAWHERYSHCATCGGPTTVEHAGYKRKCNNNDCMSNQGIHNTCYPRVDPSVIMLVVSPDGRKALLGRQKKFPGKMWSCLAGFMEPGECLEDTCRREVYEESGIEVGRIEYHSSQPWPMPASLMLGCIAYAKTEKIMVDNDELEDARWFARPELVQMLTRQHPQKLFVPPEQAIAHQIIKTWVRRTANL